MEVQVLPDCHGSNVAVSMCCSSDCCDVAFQVPMALSVRAASNLFISVVGAGVLGLPYAFRRSGLVQGIIVMVIIATLNLHCMLLLVILLFLQSSSASMVLLCNHI